MLFVSSGSDINNSDNPVSTGNQTRLSVFQRSERVFRFESARTSLLIPARGACPHDDA